MKVRVSVTLKHGVLDPQGKAIQHAIAAMGEARVADVRAGRLFELDVADDMDDAAIEALCRGLLANPVMENFSVERMSA